MTTRDRPILKTVRKRIGGRKVCPRCGHKHPPVMKIDGHPTRPKTCVSCGTALPQRLSYPAKSGFAWYVQESHNGRVRMTRCRSAEQAETIIRERERTWTANPLQRELIDYTSCLIRGIEATDREEAINRLIVELGGDSTARTLAAITWTEAAETYATDLLQNKKRSEVYAEDVRRTLGDFGAIVGIKQTRELTIDMVRTFRDALRTGSWKRDGRIVKPLGDCSIKRSLATLRAFVATAALPDRRWVNPTILNESSDAWAQATAEVENEYMPDADFKALLGSSGSRWWHTFLLVAYNSAARRGDLLRLRWSDVDLQGTRRLQEGIDFPHVQIANHKSNRGKKRPLTIPLYPSTVEALKRLREHPDVLTSRHCPPDLRDVSEADEVFPVRGFAQPESEVSDQFGAICIKAGLTVKDAKGTDQNRWSLHAIRMKANMDVSRGGGSIKDQMSLTGHRNLRVNVEHYQCADFGRMQQMVNGLSAWKAVANVAMPA